MAADTEQRTIEIILKAQDANASIKEMGAGAAVMTAQLARMGADDPGRAKLLSDLQLLNGRLQTGRAEMRGTAQSADELAAAQAKLAQENLKVVVDGQKVNATFNEMKASAAQLEKELNDLNQDDPRRKKMLDDYKALGERMGEVKKEMGSAKEESSLLEKALMFTGVEMGAEAVLDGIKELGAEIVNTTKEVAELRANINSMTGATGKDLDDLTTSVLSVSRTFGKDFNEVLVAGNTLSKQMGVSQQEAMRLIQQGFLAGADAGGDFLDQVKEYAPQFKNAGFAADEFIGHISQASNQGIFSDKGADVVKEFGLRIREQTKSTSDAMQAAFGSDFTKSIFDGINNGSLTVEQALQRVGKEMDETKIPANQLQTVIADVFGGPGEDAGIEYLKSLKNVGKGVDEVVDKTNAYTQRQQALLDSNQELAAAQNALTKEFEGGGSIIDTLTNQSMTVLYTLLASLGATFKELFAPVQEIWKSLTDLAESMGWVSKGTLSAKSAGELLGAVIHALLIPTRLVYTAIADIVKATVDWAKTSDTARGFLQVLTQPVRDLFNLLSNGPAYFAAFSAAAQESFGGIGRAWAKVKSGDFSGAKDEFMNLGKSIGDAYNKAFTEAATKKSESSATVAAPGDDAGAQRAQGGTGMTDADKKKAADAADKAAKAAKALRDKADQEHLNDVKKWVKDEGEILDSRNEANIARQAWVNTDEEQRRELQRQKIIDDADKKYNDLAALEGDHTVQMQAVVEERNLQLRELQTKFDDEDEQERQKKLAQQLADSEADDEVEKAALEVKRADGLLTEQEYQDQLYEVVRAGLEKRLALLVKAGKGESTEAKNLQAALLKGEADHTTKSKKLKEDEEATEFKIAANAAGRLKDGLQAVEDMLDKKSAAYQAFKAARKTAEIAEVGINAAAEISAIWKYAQENPLNGVTGGIAGNVLAALQTGLSVARAASSIAKIAAFADGGRTDQGKSNVMVPWLSSIAATINGASGGSFAGGGPIDKATIGLIGEAGPELVIPNWMYADPKQANLMGFLEAQIASRGNAFATGGSTTGASAVVGTDLTGDMSMAMLDVLERIDKSNREFRDEISDWQRNLVVQNNLTEVNKGLKTVQKVQAGGGIR